MKMPALLLVLALGTACTPPDNGSVSEAATPAATPAPTEAAPAPPAPAASTASATGIVEDVDPVAKKITIAHGPVESLKWPAMTMTFKAPNTDLSTIQKGDRVTFEFSSTGMDGTIVAIRHQ